MTIALYLVTATLAALLVFAAARKLSARPDVIKSYARVGVPARKLPVLAAVLLCGAAGILAGWCWPRLGLAASFGLVAYFVLALVAHARHRDLAHVAPPAALLVLSMAAIVLFALNR
jgi:hypothetical protein